MLVNELHQGGIRALIDYDNTIFNNMVLPEDVSLQDVVDHIFFKYGDAPLFSPSPDVMKYYIGAWSRRRLPLWERYRAAIELEYNPIENYDRQEDSTHTHDITATNTGDVTSKRAADNSALWENYDQDVNNLTNRDAGSVTISSHMHGNIGVTTSQQMLTSELDLIPRLDLIDYIADDWHSEFCLSIY